MQNLRWIAVLSSSLAACVGPSGSPSGFEDSDPDFTAPAEGLFDVGESPEDPEDSPDPVPPGPGPQRPPTGAVMWARGLPVDGVASARSVALGPNGAISVAGYFYGELVADDGPIASGSGYDGLLATLGADGSFVRAVALSGSSGNHFAYATAWTAAGTQVVAGGFTGDLATQGGRVEATGLWDAFIAFSDDAHVGRAHAYGNGYIVNAWGMTALDDGDFIFVGTATSPPSDSTDAPTTRGKDAFVARIGKDGGVKWSRVLGTEYDDAFLDVSVARGAASNQEIIALVGSAGGIPVAAAVDGVGNVLWARPVGGGTDTASAAVTVLPSGDMVTAFGFDSNQGLGTDIAIARLSPVTGAEQWRVRGEGHGADAARSIAATSTDGVVVVGEFEQTLSIAGVELDSRGDTDAFALALGPRGELLWAHRFGGPGADVATDVAVDSDDSSVVVGQYEGVVDFGTGSMPAAGDSNVFALRLYR